MGLDGIHDWNCQHLDKNKGQLSMCVSVTCVYVCIQLYLRFEWLILEAHS